MKYKIPRALNPEWCGRFGGLISRNVHAESWLSARSHPLFAALESNFRSRRHRANT
jgi:hypothetical protein